MLAVAACGPPASQPSPSPAASATAPAPATTSPTAAPSTPAPTREAASIAELIERIDLDRMRAHLEALAGFGSRDPRHPGHARAVAYLKEQLGAIDGVRVETHTALYNNIPLENILAVIDPPGGAPDGGWVMICAHYDSIAVRTPGWRPATDPAPGADDNATGTAALLEYARILAPERDTLAQRVVLAFFDGEELFFRGSAAYHASLPATKPYAYVVNIDMVGWNPVADRLDLIWYGAASDGLRDRVKAANDRYAIGVSPLVEVFANDPQRYILDTAPWGLGGVPAVTLSERYGPPDATYPGNTFFHTTGDTPERITNTALWLKAARLTLATALELARR